VAAHATLITVDISADGGLVHTFTSTDTANVVGESVGVFNINNVSVFSAPNAAPPNVLLDSNTLNANTLVADGLTHTLAIDITATGVSSLTGLQTLTSSFDTAGLPFNWSVMESTDINGVPVDSTTFNSPPQANSIDKLSAVLFTTPLVASEHYLLTTNGTTGDANSGIEMSVVAAPGPTLGSGLPGFALTLLGAIMLWRRRLAVSLMP
jgi:hypothetical protein